MKNILITGGAGYIGSNVAHYLLDKGCNVTVIDNLSTGNKALVPKKSKLFTKDLAIFQPLSSQNILNLTKIG